MKSTPGRIVTFYSYKGGTGRSLLLANAAMVLASNDRRVAVIDWDLEAPGLHRYFRPFLADTELNETTGLIDLFTGYWDKLTELEAAPGEPEADWVEPYLNIYRYAVTLRMPAAADGRQRGGQVVFVPAGRQNAAYASKVSSFDWDAFYANAGGRGFVDALGERLRAEFDYILIDSRTGVSDTAGICTIQLPDDLVVCFTYNNQNVSGAAGVVAEAHRARHCSERATRRLRIFPVPTRADYFLQAYLEPRRRMVKARLGWVLPDEEQRESDKYWQEVEQPYLPEHSYFETLACLTDEPTAPPPSLLQATQNVVRRFSSGEVQRWIPMFDVSERQTLRADMAGDASRSASVSSAVSAAVASPSPWTEEVYATARPLLLRLMMPSRDGNAIEFRLVPSTLFDHLGREVDELLQRGLLLTWPGTGGSRLLGLSSFSRCDPARLQAGLQSWLPHSRLLLEIEEAAQRWRASGGLDESLLPDDGWLAKNEQTIYALKAQHAFAAGEAHFLQAGSLSLANRATQERAGAKLRRTVLIGAATSAAVFIGAASYASWRVSAATAAQQETFEKLTQATFELASKSQALDAARAAQKSAQFDSSLGRGHDAYARKRFDEAVSRFSEAIEVAPPDASADVFRARGASYERLAGTVNPGPEQEALKEKAFADYQTWVKKDETASRQLQVADLAIRYGWFKRAVEPLDRAISLASTTQSRALVDQASTKVLQVQKAGVVSPNLVAEWQAILRDSLTAAPSPGTRASSGAPFTPSAAAVKK